MYHISVIINGHNEGALLEKAFLSALQCIEACSPLKLNIELIIILDAPDEITVASLDKHAKSIDLIEQVNYKDLSLSRNHGIGVARGTWIAFLDGDDLWGFSWLKSAYALSSQSNHPNLIYHPQYNILFDQQASMVQQIDYSHELYDIEYLRARNYWNSLCFAKKSIFQEVPYRQNRLDEGFGYEDWCWNCDTIYKGYEHKIVENTCHFIRMKDSNSLLNATLDSHSLMTPSDLHKIT